MDAAGAVEQGFIRGASAGGQTLLNPGGAAGRAKRAQMPDCCFNRSSERKNGKNYLKATAPFGSN